MGERKARLPCPWFVVIAWQVHRRIVRASRGRKGLWPRDGQVGHSATHHERPAQRRGRAGLGLGWAGMIAV